MTPADLAAACAATDTPGAAVGILHGGTVSTTVHGVTSRRTGVPVTDDTVFQIGSVTKPFTAALVAELVGEGRLELDTAVSELLPDVRLGVDDRGARVTVRHLLTHTSGLDGDVFSDTGRGDDAVMRYVEGLADAAVVHEPGAAYSYCNSGYVALGRIVAVLDGVSWDVALRRRLADPWGLTDVLTLPEQAVLRRAAVGHVRGAPVTTWALPRSMGPAGGVIATAADLLGLCGPLLAGTVPSVVAPPLTAIPDASELDAVGCGWRIGRWQEHRVFGHSGLTIGQSATLRVVPSLGLAICVLAASDAAEAIHARLVPDLGHTLTGVRVPDPPGPDPTAAPAGLARHVGTYVRRAAHYRVEFDDAHLRLTATPTGELARDGRSEAYRLLPCDGSGDVFVRRSSDAEPWTTVSFGHLPDGTPTLFTQGRIAPAAR